MDKDEMLDVFAQRRSNYLYWKWINKFETEIIPCRLHKDSNRVAVIALSRTAFVKYVKNILNNPIRLDDGSYTSLSDKITYTYIPRTTHATGYVFREYIIVDAPYKDKKGCEFNE